MQPSQGKHLIIKVVNAERSSLWNENHKNI